jgi:hypothetical protein
MTAPDSGRARLAWTFLEPIHGVTYFSPVARATMTDAGLTGFWRGYFGGRLAPLGPVGTRLATAVLYGFAEPMVRRAVPDIWSRATPAAILAARLDGARRTLAVPLSGVDDAALATATDLAIAVAEAADPGGRPLGAANADLPWADDPIGRLWQAATILREHRGDGHVASLTAQGVGPLASLLTHRAAAGLSAEVLRDNRGWTESQWDAGAQELVERGWLTADGELTDEGRQVRTAVERATDRAAAPPFDVLSGAQFDDWISALKTLARRVLAAGIVPYPNPMGVPNPFAEVGG